MKRIKDIQTILGMSSLSAASKLRAISEIAESKEAPNVIRTEIKPKKRSVGNVKGSKLKKYTKKELRKVKHLINQGYTRKEIAKKIGRTHSSIVGIVARRKIHKWGEE